VNTNFLKHTNMDSKAFMLIFLMVSLIFLTTCKQASEAHKDKKSYSKPIDFDFAKIKERGKLIAIVDNSSTSYFLYKGQAMGFEYDLLKMLAKELDLDLELNITTDLEEAFEKLNKGEGDIIAFNLTITKDRAKKVLFTDEHSTGRQILVQRKPNNWRKVKQHITEKKLIRNPIDLLGKEVYVRKGSAFIERLHNLSDEIGGDIIIVEDKGEVSTEELIEKVADAEIDYTIADEDVAKVNAWYYPNIDVKTAVSLPQRIAWAVRKNAPELQAAINIWLKKVKRTPNYNIAYKKYFKNSRGSYRRAFSDYSSINSNNISIYDDYIKVGAEKIGWDWVLLSSLIYQESKFDPKAKSWAGAVGLMQLVPTTAEAYGAKDPTNPKQSIAAGVKYIKWLDKLWSKRVRSKEERIKFILASYNIGQGHILDAYRLSKKYNEDYETWEVAAKYLQLKSKPKYFKDPVVTSGYAIGRETVNYVKQVMQRYQEYSQLTVQVGE